CCGHPRDLHSFPTRRSSDLLKAFFGDVAQNLIDQVAMRIEYAQAFAILDVLKDEIQEQGRLARPGRANQVGVAHPLLGAEADWRSEEHTSELQSRRDLVCRL